MKKTMIVLGVIGLVVLLLVSSLFGTYNRLVTLDENVNNQWSQVENQLKRRADLIPNLVETVKGYAAHEKEILNNVSEARSRLIGARGVDETARANGELSSALSRLLAIAENYPNLKADANFRQLSDELAGTENRIAVARRDYNDAVKEYNQTIRKVPTNIIAGIFGFEKKEYFQVEEEDKEVPKVDFGTNQ